MRGIWDLRQTSGGKRLSPIPGPLRGVCSRREMAGRTTCAIHQYFFPFLAFIFVLAEQVADWQELNTSWRGCLCRKWKTMRFPSCSLGQSAWGAPHSTPPPCTENQHKFGKLTSAERYNLTGLRTILFLFLVIGSGASTWMKSDQEICWKILGKVCSAFKKEQQEVSLSLSHQMRMQERAASLQPWASKRRGLSH